MSRRGTLKTYKEIEEELKTFSKLEFVENRQFNNYKEVIDFAIDNVYKGLDNSYPNNATKFINSKRIQCKKSKSRGIADIYRIVTNYYPDTSLEDIVNHLRGYKRMNYCYTTKQTVITPYDHLYTINSNTIIRGIKNKALKIKEN